MCLACMEYLKGNLNNDEFKRNRSEFVGEDHDAQALSFSEFEDAIDEAITEVRKDKE